MFSTLHETVHVFWRPTECVTEHELERELALLSSDELDRYNRFHFDHDRRDYALAHALIRKSLAGFLNVAPGNLRFEQQPGGKPILAAGFDSQITFNLSHTRGLVACAISSNRDLGIDAQVMRTGMDAALLEAVLAPDEVASIRQLASEAERDARFCELWTLKEAFAKATGHGLTRNFRNIVFQVDGDRGVVLRSLPPEDSGRWSFELQSPTALHRMAVAVRSQTDAACRFVYHPENI